MIEGKTDLAYTMAIEILPTIELARFQGHPARAADRRGDRRRGRRGGAAASPSRTGRSPPRREGAKAENGDRVTIDFTGKIDGVPFEGGTGGDIARADRLGHVHSGLRGAARSAWPPATQRTVKVTFPQTYPARASGRQGRRVRRHREVDRGAAGGHGRRRVRQVARPGVARQAHARWSRSGSRRSTPAMSRQKVKRKLLDELDAKHKFDAAAEPGRGRVQQRLEDDHRRPAGAQAHLRGRRHDRGEGQGRVPQHRRAARAARPRARRDRRAQQHQGHRRGAEPRRRSSARGRFPAGSRRSGTSTATTRDALASLRAPIFEDKVIDLHPRARQGHRQDGVARGALQGRRSLSAVAGAQACAGLAPGVPGTYLTGLFEGLPAPRAATVHNACPRRRS